MAMRECVCDDCATVLVWAWGSYVDAVRMHWHWSGHGRRSATGDWRVLVRGGAAQREMRRQGWPIGEPG